MSRFRIGKTPASNEFLGVLRGGGGPVIECQCGRTHVAIDSRYLTEYEKEDYLKMHKNDPEAFILADGVDGISYKSLYNLQPYVHDCVCHSYAPYEDFIWSERNIIHSFMAMKRLMLSAELDSIKDW
jgi:hypothetical protein